ncbi:hypothetical protein BN844_0916 [Pseudomonas sp. SHC52]|nr:hypothetical protein BN844_0916 [Pseudomonas sp. SHC52]
MARGFIPAGLRSGPQSGPLDLPGTESADFRAASQPSGDKSPRHSHLHRRNRRKHANQQGQRQETTQKNRHLRHKHSRNKYTASSHFTPLWERACSR